MGLEHQRLGHLADRQLAFLRRSQRNENLMLLRGKPGGLDHAFGEMREPPQLGTHRRQRSVIGVVEHRGASVRRSGRAALQQMNDSINSIPRSEEHTSELQSLMRISYAVFCLKKKKTLQQLSIIKQ